MKSSLHTLIASALLLALPGVAASGQNLNPNQTLGFANNGLVKFTYTQNYACIHEPGDDLNYNGAAAESDPGEFQTPICQAAIEPSIDPTGAPISQSEPLYVLVPLFSVDNDQNPDDAIACPDGVRPETLCGAALGSTLISLFGAVPEAYKTTPLVPTQCPDPGSKAGS